jgi:hypothetical protein
MPVVCKSIPIPVKGWPDICASFKWWFFYNEKWRFARRNHNYFNTLPFASRKNS